MIDESKLEQVLNHLLESEIKSAGSPCSAASHFNLAIVLLAEMLPDFQPKTELSRQIVNTAFEEAKLLNDD